MLPAPPSRLRALAFRLRRPLAPRGFPPRPDATLRAEVEALFGERLERYRLDAARFRAFRQACGYADEYVHYMGPRLLDEKLLEHFVSLELLPGLGAGELLVDVGSCESPFAPYVGRERGCRAYRLDLAYAPGLHGEEIGAPADAMPLESGSVAAITLHCTIDHFEGRADTGFLREAARVLRPGGRAVILPLYVARRQANAVDPRHYSPHTPFDPGAELRAVPGYGNPFGRFYSPSGLRERLLEAAPQLELRLVALEGDRIPETYLDYALLAERR